MNSWVNEFLRHGNTPALIHTLSSSYGNFRMLSQLTGNNQMPRPETLAYLLQRRDITTAQRQTILEILGDQNPTDRIMSMWSNAQKYHLMWQDFGAAPTVSLIETHMTSLNQAVGHPLPEAIEVVRGLGDVGFMTVDNFGTPLGNSGDPRNLLGTVQTEQGYMSSSLGATPPANFDRAYRMELELPPGTTGIWMGHRSAYPDQRELILPSGTRYQVTAVIPNPPGDQYSRNGAPGGRVQWLIRARVLRPEEIPGA
ncbi:ADP-ribosyltransferase [Nocardia callitridis]|uniref:ADP-ribosyltransferase n=1 Tax=Nocardia callitridis TaxID=648753 RepID=UPI0031EF1D2F